MGKRGWLAAAIGGCALALSGSVLGSSATSAGGSTDHPARYQDGTIGFSYPRSWHPARWPVMSSFSALITFLSTDPLHDPCTRTPNMIACASPLETLSPGGVLVSWSEHGFPGWTFAREPGRVIRVGPAPAKIQFARPGNCGTLGADETITAVIPSGQDNWYELDACLRAPGVAASARQVLAMLESARLARPPATPAPPSPAPRAGAPDGPPPAWIETDHGSFWLKSVAGGCWTDHVPGSPRTATACATPSRAPLSPHQLAQLPRIVLRRGEIVHVHLDFAPTRASAVEIGGRAFGRPALRVGLRRGQLPPLRVRGRSGLIRVVAHGAQGDATYAARLVIAPPLRPGASRTPAGGTSRPG